jgi:hypothetical protein
MGGLVRASRRIDGLISAGFSLNRSYTFRLGTGKREWNWIDPGWE